jgi:hypothetical protein
MSRDRRPRRYPQVVAKWCAQVGPRARVTLEESAIERAHAREKRAADSDEERWSVR